MYDLSLTEKSDKGSDTWCTEALLRENLTPEALRYGTRCQEISQFYLLSTRLAANRFTRTNCALLYWKIWKTSSSL